MKKISNFLISSFIITALLLAQSCRSGEYKEITAAELTSLVDSFPPQAKLQFKETARQRKELIDTIKRMYALASAAQADGLDKKEEFKRKFALQTDVILATEENKQNPQAEVTKPEKDAYFAAHAKDFETDTQTMRPKTMPAPTGEELDSLKEQWAELKVRAERARKAGLDKTGKLPLQMKIQRANMLANEYSKTLEEKLKPTPDELKKYRAENPKADLDKIKKQAEDVLARVKKGDDFAKLASEFSEDGSAAQGGDLGWFTKEKMVKEFSEAAFALKPGETSGLVKSQFGWHLIKLEERRMKKPDPKAPKPPAPPAKPGEKPAVQGPEEEVRARHILFKTEEAEGAEQALAQKKTQRAMEDTTLKFKVTVPEDFPVNVAAGDDRGLQLPKKGMGQGGNMAPINPGNK